MHQLLSGLLGAVIGLVTAAIVGDDRRSGMLDAVVGALGAVPGAWFLMPLSSQGVIGALLSTVETLGAVGCAVFVLALWILFRRGDR